MHTPIHSDGSPAPRGHYSQAVRAGGALYVSTQMPSGPGVDPDAPGTVEEQTVRTLSNIRTVLQAGGADLRHLARVTVYVTDMGHWERVNRAYAEFMGEFRPARGVVNVAGLHAAYQVAMDAVAVLE